METHINRPQCLIYSNQVFGDDFKSGQQIQ